MNNYNYKQIKKDFRKDFRKYTRNVYSYPLLALMILTVVFIGMVANGLKLTFYGYIGVFGYFVLFYIYSSIISYLIEKVQGV